MGNESLLNDVDLDTLKEALEAAFEPVYFCPNCNEKVDDPIQVRECSNDNCGTRYNGTDEGRNCPDCNRPFTRKLTDNGCDSCFEENECEAFSLAAIEAEIKRQEALPA